jgi:hypothetical protein
LDDEGEDTNGAPVAKKGKPKAKAKPESEEDEEDDEDSEAGNGKVIITFYRSHEIIDFGRSLGGLREDPESEEGEEEDEDTVKRFCFGLSS